MSIDIMIGILREYWPLLLQGAARTLVLALVGTSTGLLIGLLLAVLRSAPLGKNPIKRLGLRLLKALIAIYVEVFRSTPMIVQAMIIYYGSALFLGWDIGAYPAALFIISVNTGAYLSEIVRGGILAIDKGQFEAAQSLGLSHAQLMRQVILPQCFKSILPAIGNEFVINIKDSAVLNVITVNELFFVSKSIAGANFHYFETFVLSSGIYFILCFSIGTLLRRYERQLKQPSSYTLQSALMKKEELV